ncbi:MAG: hypothetical protein ACSHYF_00340 [Verrucomicrobiaceae bacterium]
MKVTTRLVRLHNASCCGRALVALVGGVAIYGVWVLFIWSIFSLPGYSTGFQEVGTGGMILSLLSPAVFFAGGIIYLKRTRPHDWRKQLPDFQVDPGSRIAHPGGAGWSSHADGTLKLVILSGSMLLRRIWLELGAWVPERKENIDQLERVRLNLAARATWERLADFEDHLTEIRELVGLGLVALRENAGCWYLRIALKGENREANRPF